MSNLTLEFPVLDVIKASSSLFAPSQGSAMYIPSILLYMGCSQGPTSICLMILVKKCRQESELIQCTRKWANIPVL